MRERDWSSRVIAERARSSRFAHCASRASTSSSRIITCPAVLNPKRQNSEYPDRDLAAVGVAFKLMLALAEKLGANANFVYNMLDLVALATIADVAPLRGENRIFARYGLRLMAETPHVGLRALM